LDGIPLELTAGRRFCCFHAVPQPNGKLKKLPVVPDTRPDRRGSHLAKSNDPHTWRAWADVVRNAEVRRLYLGLVLVLGDGLIVIDLDNVVDSDGAIDPAAADLVVALGTFTELSAGRRGLHLVGYGELPPRGILPPLGPGRPPPELAPRRSNRLLLLTGFTLPGFATLRPIGDALARRVVTPANAHRISRPVPRQPPGESVVLTEPELHRLTQWASRHWSQTRHYLTMGLAGALANGGVPEDQATRIVRDAAMARGDRELDDRLTVLVNTYARVRAGLPVSGFDTLRQRCLLGEPSLGLLRSVLQAAAARRQEAAQRRSYVDA
jgi:hypothetical protein